MNARGQLWSLDVVLAAVVFTLAIGILLSQSELHVLYGQQDTLERGLDHAALFASSALTSNPQFLVPTIPEGCTSSSCGAGLYAPSLIENLRCGPNAAVTGTQASHSLEWKGWGFDHDLSGMENCLIDQDAPYSADTLGVSPSFALAVQGPSGSPLQLYPTTSLPSGSSFISFSRRMLVFPDHVDAVQLRQCMDGACGSQLKDVTVQVWRP